MAETGKKLFALWLIVSDITHCEDRTPCNKGEKGGLINISDLLLFFHAHAGTILV